MTLPLVSNTDTLGVFVGRTNQVIGLMNQFTDGILTVNGSLSFANATFAMSLPSINVANNIVLTQPSGNSIFLQSSGMTANGTIYARGAANGLMVTNTSQLFGNVYVGGILRSENEIKSYNANTQSGQFRAVNANVAAILRNNGNTFSILSTGGVVDPRSNTFNTRIPISINLFDNTVTINDMGTNQINGTTYLNGTTHTTGSLLIDGTGTAITVANNAQVGGTAFIHNIDVTNGLITLDSVQGATIHYNGGNNTTKITSSLNVAGDLTVTTNANFLGIVSAAQFHISALTSDGTRVNGDLEVTGNLTNDTQISAQLINIAQDLTVTGHINAASEIRSNGPITGLTGQYRAINGNYGVLFRNDGTNFSIVSTSATVTPATDGPNTFKPFTYNLATGSVLLDGTARGTTLGGPLQVGSSLTATNGVTITPTGVTIPNNSSIYGRPAANTTPYQILGTDNTNKNYFYAGPGGLTMAFADGTPIFTVNPTTKVTTFPNTVSTPSSSLVLNNGAFLQGDNTGGQAVPIIGIDQFNEVSQFMGPYGGTLQTPGGWRLLSSDGVYSIITVSGTGLSTIYQYNGTGPYLISSCLIVGNVGIPTNTIGVIAAGHGYLCKPGGSFGTSFRNTSFNIDYDGTGITMYIEDQIVGRFAGGFNVSDPRTKTNIRSAYDGDALDRIKQINTILYNFKDNSLVQNDTIDKLGFLTTELMEVNPTYVNGAPDAILEDGRPDPQSLNVISIVADVVDAIKDLSDKYEKLEARIAALENK